MDRVRRSVDDGVATITIDRPEVLNAMNSATREELTASMEALQGDDSVRAVVLTGAGDRAFSAGQDINESRSFQEDDAGEWVEEWDALYETLLDFDVPTVAKLNGDAIGAAFQVALLCDLRIASDTARVGMNEINIGIPCILGSWIIDNIAGHSAAAEITLTGDPIDAGRAVELGLVTRTVPDDDLDEAVADLAGSLAAKPRAAMEEQTRWLRGHRFDGDLRAVSEAGSEIHARVYESGEPEERMGEFLDSR